MNNEFILDSRLKNDGEIIGELELCQVLLVNNKLFPWVILIPKRANKSELIDLTAEDSASLMREINLVSKIMQSCFKPDKLNVAALGNIVAQLHIHIVARFKNDQVWPAPVFGKDKELYNQTEYNLIKEKIGNALCKK